MRDGIPAPFGGNRRAIHIETKTRLFAAAIIGECQLIPGARFQTARGTAANLNAVSGVAEQPEKWRAGVDLNRPAAQNLLAHFAFLGDLRRIHFDAV